jgi:hypothetical protein
LGVVDDGETAKASGLLQVWRNRTATDNVWQQAANSVALLVGSSQPFYPLGIVWIIGEPGWASAVAWATTPVFLAVPFVGHVSAVLGRLLLAFAGTLVTLLVVLRLGPGCWVEAYYIPVLLVAALLFREGEEGPRRLAFSLPVIALVIGRLGAGPDVAEAGRLWLLHMGGALGLSVYVLFVHRQARRAFATLQETSDSAKHMDRNSSEPFRGDHG